MYIRPLHEFTLYRYRYGIGYLLLIVLTIGLLFLNIETLPAGLSEGEKSSALASSQIIFDKSFLEQTKTIDLPYHIVQKFSLDYIGLNALGVRLPSVIFASLSAIMLFFMLRRWLQPNVAVVMGIIIGTSSWFLSIGRLGMPDVMVLFWTALIVLLATLISQETKRQYLWKALIIIVMGLSLYTPHMIYLFVIACIAAIAQPHLRYLIKYTEKTSISLGILVFLATLIPLAWHIWREPSIIQMLVLPPIIPGPVEFLKQIVEALSKLVNPFHQTLGYSPTPLISIPMTVFAIIGVVRVFVDYHSVRSHVLLIWWAILIPLIGLTTNHNLVLLFVPVVLLSAIGVQSLFRYWYSLFPLNPYARVVGLLPLAVLVVSIVQFNYQHYFMALPYAPDVAKLYDQDPLLLHKTLRSKAYRNKKVVLIVPEKQVALYAINKPVVKNLEIITPVQFTTLSDAASVIIAENSMPLMNANQLSQMPQTKTELLVNDRKDNGLRFRVYNP